MDQVSIYLILVSALFLLGALGEVIFRKTQIPDVVWLIGAGVILRMTGLVDPTDPAVKNAVPLFAAVTLIIVLFEGGRTLVIEDLVKSAPRATVLALLGFVITTLLVAVLSMGAAAIGIGLPENWSFLHGLMLGAMVGGSSSLVIMPSMTVAKVKERVANLVGLESAFTDALCVVVTGVMIEVILAGQASSGDGVSAAQSAGAFATNLGVGIGVGAAAGWSWFPLLRFLRGSQHAYPVTLAALLGLYVVVSKLGGNAAIGILAFSIMVGNADALMKKAGFSMGENPLKIDESVQVTNQQVSFIIKTFFFTFIGINLGPPWSLLFFGIVVGGSLFAARIPAVKIALRGTDFDEYETSLINVSIPRGMAAGVLATLPAIRGIKNMEDLPALVFAAVVTSIAIFAGGFRKVQGSAPKPAAEPGDESMSVAQAGAPTDALGEGGGAPQLTEGAPASGVPVATTPPVTAPPGAAPPGAAPSGAAPTSGEPSAQGWTAAPAQTPTTASPAATPPAAPDPSAPVASRPAESTAPQIMPPQPSGPMMTPPVTGPAPGAPPDPNAGPAPQKPQIRESEATLLYAPIPAEQRPAPNPSGPGSTQTGAPKPTPSDDD